MANTVRMLVFTAAQAAVVRGFRNGIDVLDPRPVDQGEFAGKAMVHIGNRTNPAFAVHASLMETLDVVDIDPDVVWPPEPEPEG